MPLECVTITGADDNTPVQAMIDLSDEFPFLEWGVLVSKRQEGSPRFPSAGWCERLITETRPDLRVSMHVCGSWVREILQGTMDADEFPPVRRIARRIQLNTHAETHISTVAAFDWLAHYVNGGAGPIFQLDGVNDHLLDAALARGLKAHGLFDRSHGAGVVPDSWPFPISGVYCGYAGGLGPDNVIAELKKIRAQLSTDVNYWIDMEGRVRDAGEHLDLNKVLQVLRECKPWIGVREP